MGTVSYVDSLFERYKRLVILLMDFYLAGDMRAGLGGPLEPLLEHFSTLRNQMKRRVGVFEHLAGYVAHVEYGAQKKHHVHAVLFFDGDAVRNHYGLSQHIANRWGEITKGFGRYFNPQEKAGQYNCPAIGMVRREDREKRRCLLYVLWYITKPDQFLPYKLNDKQRLFFRGELLG